MKVGKFLQLNDPKELEKLQRIKKAIKGRNYIGPYKSKDFISFSFSKVEQLKEWYTEGNIIYLVSATCGIGQNELLKRNYEDLVYYLKFIDDQMRTIAKLESTLSEKDDDETEEYAKLELCGINELDIFGIVNVIDSLAGGDFTKWKEVEQYPWKVIYTKLLKNKKDARIERRRQKLDKK